MSSFFEWTASVDWRLVVTWASGVLVLVNIVFLLFTIGCDDGVDLLRMRHENLAWHVEDLEMEIKEIRDKESRQDDEKTALERRGRLEAEIKRQRVRLKTVRDLSKASEECRKRLDEIKARMDAINDAYRKAEIISRFCDAAGRDGFWDTVNDDHEKDQEA